MHEWIDGCMSACMDGWMHEWIHGYEWMCCVWMDDCMMEETGFVFLRCAVYLQRTWSTACSATSATWTVPTEDSVTTTPVCASASLIAGGWLASSWRTRAGPSICMTSPSRGTSPRIVAPSQSCRTRQQSCVAYSMLRVVTIHHQDRSVPTVNLKSRSVSNLIKSMFPCCSLSKKIFKRDSDWNK